MNARTFRFDPSPGTSAALFCAGALALAAAAVWFPVPAAAGALAAATLVGIIVAADRRPHETMIGLILIVLIAGTKFRRRDPLLATAAVADAQVLFELALYALMAVAAVISLGSGAASRDRPRRTELALGALAVLATASTVWSPVSTLTLVRSVQLSILLFVVAVAVRVLGPPRFIGGLHRCLVGYVLVSATVAVLVPVTSETYIWRGLGRFSWFHTHPITVASLAGIAATAIFARRLFATRSTGRWSSLAAWGAFALACAIVIATRSRGPLAALVIASALLLVRRYVPSIVRTVLICAIASLLAASVIVGYTPADALEELERSSGLFSRYLLRGQSAEEILEFSGRFELWGGIAPFIGDRPFAGHGYISSRAVTIDLISWLRGGGYAHNAFLQTLLDFGLLGFLLLWVPILRTLFSGALSRQTAGPTEARATVFAMMLFLVVNSLSTETFAGPPGFELFLVLGLVIAAERMSSRVEPASRSRPVRGSER